MNQVDEFISRYSGPQKNELERIRNILAKAFPDAEEVISYGIPGLKYKGKYLVGYAALKNHFSLFPTSGPIMEFKEELKDFKLSKGTIQYTSDNLISESLVKELVQNRLADILKG